MDYKLRVGPLEYMDPRSKRWLPEPPHAPGESPVELTRRKLREAADAIAASGLDFAHVLNSALLFPGLRERAPECSTEPILLYCTAPGHPWGVLVTWDQELERHVLYSGRPVALSLGADDGGEPVHIHVFLVHVRLGEHTTTEEVTFWARCHLAAFRGPER